MGPTRTASYSGNRYMLLFVDDFSRFTWVYFVKEKSEVFSKFREFKEMVEGELCRKVRVLRTDNGGEFCSKEFALFCRKNGIRRELSCPETPQQNGIAERKIRHLTETCKSWLHMKNLPRQLWAEGMKCAAHVINRVPLSPNQLKSPFEMVYGLKPNVKHFRVFGSICYVHVPDSRRSKLDTKSIKCVFVGYDERRKGWRCMDPATHKCTVSRDVVFDEISSFYIKDSEERVQTNLPITTNRASDGSSGDRGSCGPNSHTPVEERLERRSPQREESSPRQTEDSRPKRNTVRPSRFRDDNFVTTFSCFLANAVDDEEPSSFDEAKDVKEWVTAMEEEMHALEKNETWDVVPKPTDAQAVSCKWVYRIKRKADGSVDRYKARLVARGFSQKYGEDYEETFSPVAKMTSIRTVLALAASSRWKLWQMDVKNAFLYGELDRPIYMEQPPGFEKEGDIQLVCRLKKALYGLKQAPRAWYGKIAEYLRFCGYEASESDSSLFVKKQNGQLAIVLLYVDDLILTGSNCEEVVRLQDELSLRFEMKKLGEVGSFLGLQIESLKEGLFVSQTTYAKMLVQKFGVIEGKKRYTPLDVSPRLSREEGTLLSDPRQYRALVGSLIYLTITRPDISFAVGVVGRYMQEPRKPHLEEAKKILKYVNTTLDVGLLYECGATFTLQGFADADFAGDRDDRKSTSGFVFLCGTTSISWSSRKQGSVSLSTTEAEYKASAHAAQECIWLRRLVEDLHVKIDKPVPIHGDNLSAIKLASNPVFHARTKHIEVEHHFVREKVLDGIIEMSAVSSEDNVADIFTKALARSSFEGLRSKLGLISRTSLQGGVLKLK